MADQIGVSFIPSADNQQAPDGPPQGQLSGDLAAAFKILSLRLPQVMGAHALAPNALLQSPGALGVPGALKAPGGFNPYAALFETLLKHGLGVGQPTGQPTSTTMPVPGMGGAPQPMGPPPVSNYNPPAPPPMSSVPTPPAPPRSIGPPAVHPGSNGDIGNTPAPNPSPTFSSWMNNERNLGRQRY